MRSCTSWGESRWWEWQDKALQLCVCKTKPTEAGSGERGGGERAREARGAAGPAGGSEGKGRDSGWEAEIKGFSLPRVGEESVPVLRHLPLEVFSALLLSEPTPPSWAGSLLFHPLPASHGSGTGHLYVRSPTSVTPSLNSTYKPTNEIETQM